jgi:hypothetical protein
VVEAEALAAASPAAAAGNPGLAEAVAAIRRAASSMR